jgi:hypothetical protein
MMNREEREKSDIRKNRLTRTVAGRTSYLRLEPSMFAYIIRRGSVVVTTLCDKPEGRGFEIR